MCCLLGMTKTDSLNEKAIHRWGFGPYPMRYYSPTIKQRVKSGPNTIGIQLARLAVKHDYSVVEIATMTGASRQTVYNWYAGHKVSNAYAAHVRKLIEHIKNKGAL